MEKLEWCSYTTVKNFWRYVYSFWQNPRTWQMDGHTPRDSIRRICIAACGKNEKSCSWCTVISPTDLTISCNSYVILTKFGLTKFGMASTSHLIAQFLKESKVNISLCYLLSLTLKWHHCYQQVRYSTAVGQQNLDSFDRNNVQLYMSCWYITASDFWSVICRPRCTRLAVMTELQADTLYVKITNVCSQWMNVWPPPDSLRMSSDVTIDTFSSSNISHSSIKHNSTTTILNSLCVCVCVCVLLVHMGKVHGNKRLNSINAVTVMSLEYVETRTVKK